MLGIFHPFTDVSLLYLKINFNKNLSGKLSECQTVWIQISTNLLSVLIWVKTVCKGYQQMTKVTASKETVKYIFISPLTLISNDI